MSEFAGFRRVPPAGPRKTSPYVIVTPALAFVIVAGLIPEATSGATVDDIALEVVKTIGIIISAVAAMYCAKVATENRHTARRTEAKVDRKRELVRKVDHPDGAKVVIEEGDRKRRGEDD